MSKFKNNSVHTQYKTKDGIRVPGVTTVLGVLAKPALIHWAWDLGVQGIDYRKYRDATATVGTLAHALIAHELGAEKPDLTAYSAEIIDKAENAILSFYEWQKDNKIEPLLIEQPLVSEQYRFGGTIDCLAMLNGKLTLLDLKTGKAIYDEMYYQLAAYRQLLLENGHEIKEAMILRVGRDETEGFDPKKVTDFASDWEVFKSCLNIYKNKRNSRQS